MCYGYLKQKEYVLQSLFSNKILNHLPDSATLVNELDISFTNIYISDFISLIVFPQGFQLSRNHPLITLLQQLNSTNF